jgi:hypothetical protein
MEAKEKLKNFITMRLKKARDDSKKTTATPEEMRLMNPDSFMAKLDSLTLLEGFTIIKKEFDGHPAYTITCDAHSECFINIWMEQSRELEDNGKYHFFCYARIFEIHSDIMLLRDIGGSGIIHFLLQIEDTIKGFNKRKTKFEALDRDKEFWQNQIDTELARVCAEIKCPYHVIKQPLASVLYVQLEDNSCLNISIPYKNAVEILPGLSNIIQKYIYLQKTSKAKVLIYKCSKYTNWEWKENNPYGEA